MPLILQRFWSFLWSSILGIDLKALGLDPRGLCLKLCGRGLKPFVFGLTTLYGIEDCCSQKRALSHWSRVVDYAHA